MVLGPLEICNDFLICLKQPIKVFRSENRLVTRKKNAINPFSTRLYKCAHLEISKSELRSLVRTKTVTVPVQCACL